MEVKAATSKQKAILKVANRTAKNDTVQIV